MPNGSSTEGSWFEQHAGKIIAGLLTASIIGGSAAVVTLMAKVGVVQATQESQGTVIKRLEDRLDNLWTRQDQVLFVESLRRELDAEARTTEYRLNALEKSGGAR